VTLPPGVRGPDVVARVQERGWVIGGGYGKLKESTVRIGHMGDHRVEALAELLDVVERVLAP
jgi:aspartate aminotransferase-like enzyme